jgi:hypothetical protein
MPSETRLQRTIAYLVDRNVSSASDFEQQYSPQYNAAEWIATEDDASLTIPTHNQSLSDAQAYRFVTRYILALLYYATHGENWYDSCHWFSESDVCSWTNSSDSSNRNVTTAATTRKTDGSGMEAPVDGVGCNDDREIQSLSLGKCNIYTFG